MRLQLDRPNDPGGQEYKVQCFCSPRREEFESLVSIKYVGPTWGSAYEMSTLDPDAQKTNISLEAIWFATTGF